mmetsp:Transcript_44781/g.124097  ORF Transcript_44781/g.124097 Transcript_44781/m.124097 type:complete len:234 (+) Transcript_44781:1200-1901(+)
MLERLWPAVGINRVALFPLPGLLRSAFGQQGTPEFTALLPESRAELQLTAILASPYHGIVRRPVCVDAPVEHLRKQSEAQCPLPASLASAEGGPERNDVGRDDVVAHTAKEVQRLLPLPVPFARTNRRVQGRRVWFRERFQHLHGLMREVLRRKGPNHRGVSLRRVERRRISQQRQHPGENPSRPKTSDAYVMHRFLDSCALWHLLRPVRSPARWRTHLSRSSAIAQPRAQMA